MPDSSKWVKENHFMHQAAQRMGMSSEDAWKWIKTMQQRVSSLPEDQRARFLAGGNRGGVAMPGPNKSHILFNNTHGRHVSSVLQSDHIFKPGTRILTDKDWRSAIGGPVVPKQAGPKADNPGVAKLRRIMAPPNSPSKDLAGNPQLGRKQLDPFVQSTKPYLEQVDGRWRARAPDPALLGKSKELMSVPGFGGEKLPVPDAMELGARPGASVRHAPAGLSDNFLEHIRNTNPKASQSGAKKALKGIARLLTRGKLKISHLPPAHIMRAYLGLR